MKNQKGFTKMEVIIILVLLVILGTIIWLAVDPFTRFSQERDNIRRSQVVQVLNAVLKYKTMNGEELPQGIDDNPATAQVLGVGTTGCDLSCGAVQAELSCLDLSEELVDEYLEEVPFDPSSGSAANTDYYINVTSSGRILVGACDPERSNTISVTR